MIITILTILIILLIIDIFVRLIKKPKYMGRLLIDDSGERDIYRIELDSFETLKACKDVKLKVVRDVKLESLES